LLAPSKIFQGNTFEGLSYIFVHSILLDKSIN